MSECRFIREVFYLRVGTESEARKGYYKVMNKKMDDTKLK